MKPILLSLSLALSLAAPVTVPAQNKTVKAAKRTATKALKNTQRAATRLGRSAQTAAKKAGRTTAAAAKGLAATPTWPALRAAYDYKANEVPEVKEVPVESEGSDAQDGMMTRISFSGANGKPVVGLFLRPKAEGVYPCALVLHGLTNNKEIAVKMFGNALVAKGIAVLALDAPEHGQEQSPNKKYWNAAVITNAVHEGDRNYRIALDYLANRPDVDSKRIGAVGYSLGSIMSCILGAVDGRVTAFALCVGGDPFLPVARVTANATRRKAIFEVSPSLFVGHIAPRPIMFFNGKKDAVVVQPAARLLHGAAQEPKTVEWYNGGHDVPDAIRAKAVAWLAEKLKAGAAKSEPEGGTEGETKTEAQP